MLVSVPVEWLALLAVAAPVVVYLWGRRASHAATLTESRVLTEKSVKNIEEQWTKLDDIKDRIAKNSERMAYLEGVRDGEKKSQNTC